MHIIANDHCAGGVLGPCSIRLGRARRAPGTWPASGHSQTGKTHLPTSGSDVDALVPERRL